MPPRYSHRPASRQRYRAASKLAILALVIAACSNQRPDVVPVSGVVLRKGQPVPRIVVSFFPEKGRTSWGETDAAGKFVLHYTKDQDGARLGKHRVMVSPLDGGPQFELARAQGKAWQGHPELQAILEKYGDPKKTPLEVEITEAGQFLELKID